MIKKKLICVTVVLCMSAGLAACGKDEEDTEIFTTTEQTAEITTESDIEDTFEDTEEVAEEDSEEDSDSGDSADNGDSSGSYEAVGDGAYVDFDDMCFYVNGKKYVLGVNTLQDMIDDGVPFDEGDIANAGNNLNPNYQSQGFAIELADYLSAQVYTLNDTSDNMVTSECYINEIYFPLNPDIEQNILGFNFPLNMTMEDLVAQAGEPDDTDHYDGDNGYYKDTLKYERESEKYYSSSHYSFEFINGELRYIYITYMP